nr:NAD(P)-dependent oxidoreductase [Tissierella sp.]
MSINSKLSELHSVGKNIKVSLIGAGLMGKGMVSQMMLMKGMTPSLVVSNNINDAIESYTLAGIDKKDIKIAKNLKDVNIAMEAGKFVVSDQTDLGSAANLVDVVVDATGSPEAGAKIAMDSILNKKHIVMVNVEADVTVGPILNKLAKNAGLVYTGTAGDEPGSVKEIYDFADALGFEIIAIGKGKNNPIDFAANPDTVRETALSKNLKPLRLASFVDGTNTMIEMAAMSNSTGFIPDIRGAHGVHSGVKELSNIFRLKKDGGILENIGVVDYVHGIAPGVFAVVSTSLEQIHTEMKYLSMGDGPNYVLYRPYHLTSLETPITVANAYFYNEATIAPIDGLVSEVVTIAKLDLKEGEYLDGIGEFKVLGTIEEYEKAKTQNLLPIGLVNRKTRVKKAIKKGEFITYDMVELDKTSYIYKLRQMQEAIF